MTTGKGMPTSILTTLCITGQIINNWGAYVIIHHNTGYTINNRGVYAISLLRGQKQT